MAEIDHVEMGPEGAIPVCLGCLSELAEVCDGRRDALVEAVEASLSNGAWPVGSGLAWDRANDVDVALMVAAL